MLAAVIAARADERRHDRSASKEALIANFHEWREFYPPQRSGAVIIQRRLCRPLPICRYRNAR